MKEIEIIANASSLSINGLKWDTAPLTKEICYTLNSHPPADGEHIIINRQIDSKFRYFDSLGISIIENVSTCRARRISIHLQIIQESYEQPYSYREGMERSTTSEFRGVLKINGQELRNPFSYDRFPANGDLNFVHGIALGAKLSAMVFNQPNLVQKISFEFADQQ